ncbi:MAG: hypothetical protein EBX37_18890, partial [Alphaproteobacteria bacterium]|nr:hypothetical protein [Alphaproteobacteria bacterium]
RYNDESLSYDFLPRAVNMASLSQEKPGSRPLAWAHSGTLSAAPAPESSAHHLRLNIDVVNAPATLQIRQLYLPGWQLRINGQPHPATPGDDGRLAAVLETPGAYTVEAWYEGPPGWGLRNAAIVLISMAALLLLRRLTTGGPA